MALVWDRKFKPYVDEYAKDEDKFFKVRPGRGAGDRSACKCGCIGGSKDPVHQNFVEPTPLLRTPGLGHAPQDFAAAFGKLLALGVPGQT
jgi:hypothetical protein